MAQVGNGSEERLPGSTQSDRLAPTWVSNGEPTRDMARNLQRLVLGLRTHGVLHALPGVPPARDPFRAIPYPVN